MEPTAEWKGFLRRHEQHVVHSGVGLGYCLEQAGKRWSPLRRSNGRRRHPVLAGVYADLIFHLGAATRKKTFFTNPQIVAEADAMLLRRRMAGWLRRVLPQRIRRGLSPLRSMGRLYDQRPEERNEVLFAELRGELFAHPDRFLAQAMGER